MNKRINRALETIRADIEAGWSEGEAIAKLHPATQAMLSRQGIIRWDSDYPMETLRKHPYSGGAIVVRGGYVPNKNQTTLPR